jgi:rare lipoprotein A
MFRVEIAAKIRRFGHSAARILVLAPVFLTLSGCDLKMPSFGGSDESDRLSPRVVQLGQPVPKGGGRYKLGSPYKINGQRYVPREVTHYEETGVASWYGELFHGRLTANGEVYDMEALSAAHPTLPLPSYVRVTNLRNDRAVVLRVNDRGPYSRGRLIDLSWAAASLLKMESAGTAPVRVEYLGRAPLNGSDRYERDYLARQRWAGPQIAYAESPGKAARHLRSAQAPDVDRNEKEPVSVASVRQARPVARVAASSVPPLPVARSAAVPRIAPLPRLAAAPQVAPMPQLGLSRPVPAIQMGSASPQQMPDMIYYIQAGRFTHRPVADSLAAILDEEIAPASVETARSEKGLIHLVRIGPFRQSADAQLLVAKIKAAGLKDAYVERVAGG